MIKSISILDGINQALAAIAQGKPIYRDAMPTDFERPSYFIALGAATITQDGPSSMEVKQPFRIQCIDEVNEHYEADTDRLHDMGDRVRALLLCGFVRVGDRALHIESVKLDREVDVASVTATLHYWDILPRGALAEPMGEITITNENGGN